MNKIYKVKKNTAGNSVACSEFAKGHTKKAVLGSLLIIGALGMASTTNAQAKTLEQVQSEIFDLIDNSKDIQALREGKLDQERFQKFMLLNQQANALTTDDLNNNVQENTQKIGNIQNLYNTQIRTWNKNDKTIEEHEKSIKENKDSLSALTRKTFQNQADIVRNNESIEDLYEYGQQVADSIKDIHDHNKAQNDTIQDLITNSTKNTDNIAKNKADVDAKFKGVQTDIANNKITLAQHTKKIDDNQRAIEAKLGDKADLQKLAELKTSVDKNQTDIVKNKADIQDLAKVQQAGVKAIEELNKNVQANKAAADTKFTATEDAIAKNAKDITKNTTSISALDTKVSGFDGRINTLDSKVDTFDGRISALDSKVNTFDGRINALDDRFKNGMAAQAALNGLFQPYSVGKVSVSAAIGGYGSKSAIAIGAGYRVNPQLAFKGGTAINVSGSKKGSYNIGVNYEF